MLWRHTEVYLKSYGIHPDSWKEAALVCTTWHSLINTGVTAHEEESQ